MFRKALIANRGEIACRIIRTMRRMGIGSVAIYSAADAQAPHVKLADEAWPIGPPQPRDSYLSAEKIVETALDSGAEAVHPGYGFLSESPQFAERCRQAGLVFVGPSPEAMLMAGDKGAAKNLVSRLVIPALPGFQGETQDFDIFAAAAREIGFPIVVKAVAGGGGRGMRVVGSAHELRQAMEDARREAQLAFGDDRLLLEKYLEQPRHVEIQFVADAFGDVVTFFERDCSLQRKHQKLIEETPAPFLPAALRAALRDAAARIARAASYVGAGTAEFLVKDDDFYFLEVNARLQVEHPVTEMISGVDLVEWQFRVAAGEALPLRQEALQMRGSAIEARICAEDPARGFLPSSGLIEHLRLPPQSENLRLEVGVQSGDAVPPFYDSLLAKLIVWDEDRAGAVRRMRKALADVELVGVASNLSLLRSLIDDPRFVSGRFDTSVVEKVTKTAMPMTEQDEPLLLAAAGAAWLRDLAASKERESDPWSPWASLDGWRLYDRAAADLDFRCEGRALHGRMGVRDDNQFWIKTESAHAIASASFAEDRLTLFFNGLRQELGFVSRPTGYVFIVAGRNYFCERIDPLAASAPENTDEKCFVAQFPARVARIFVKQGDRVEKGAPLLVLEAMKMEIAMNAPMDGIIEKVLCSEGQSVREGEELVGMEAQ